MRVLGKIAGAGIGYFFGGPFGALAGVALGHQLFDRTPREFFGVPLSEREIRNSVFFAASFAMLGKLAKADGRVSEEEIIAIKSIIKDKLKLSRRSADFAYRTFEESLVDDETFEIHAKAFHSKFTDAPEALASMLEIMLIVAYADFDYNEDEETLIKLAATIFGIESEYPSILALFRGNADNIEHCYELLGAKPNDSDEALDALYQHLLVEHDPQVLLDEGVPKELIALAKDQHTKIRFAYEQVVASRGQQSGVRAT